MHPLTIQPRVAAASITLILASVAASSTPCRGQAMRNPRRASQLESRISVTWRGQELVNAKERLTELYGVDVWLDRRVDPRALVDLTVNDRTVWETLQLLAERHGLGATVFDDLVYIGPNQSSSELATLAANARDAVDRMPLPNRRRWMQPSQLRWKRLAEPRGLVQDLVATAGGDLSNPDSIPHDLWNAGDLRRMPVVDALVLLLSGFDLTIQFSADGAGVRIMAIERPVLMVREYQLTSQRLRALQPLLQTWAGARLESSADRHRLAASWEQHQQVREVLGGNSANSAPPRSENTRAVAPPSRRRGRQRYTLQLVDKPLGAVLDQLADQLGLTVRWSEQLNAQTLRGRLVSCDVRQADQRQLLDAVLGAAGLSCRITGSGLIILPAD